MDVAARVKLKSDRRARALIVALCTLPVATPLLAAGVNVFMTANAAQTPSTAPIASPAPASEAPFERPPLRASFDSPVFSPEPMGGRPLAEPAPIQQQMSAHDRQPAPSSLKAGLARVLRDVTIVDGLQIKSDGMVITLAGVGPAPQGSECRRLDGVVEPCAQRAANRLDILTRGRPVVCDLQDADSGMRGVCRAGKIDLAEDLVRNGLVVRTSDKL